MNLLATAALALAMSADAFAAAIGKGAALHRPRWTEAVRTGLIFGAIEALTPLIGWALGKVAAPYVTAWDHWIAFTLLAVLGARMIRAGFTADDDDGEEDKPSTHAFWVLALTGLATSIDAMAVGAGLALVGEPIATTAAAIGLSTCVMVTLGVMLGRALGRLVGKRAEVAGGVVLVGIGCAILVQHLGGA
jgi:putative Mn2+ efflux pump MntP